VIGNAVHVMRILTGQITDDVPTPEDEGKDLADASPDALMIAIGKLFNRDCRGTAHFRWLALRQSVNAMTGGGPANRNYRDGQG
jgi:hypothetical protein